MKIKLLLFLLYSGFFGSLLAQKVYHKAYYSNGILKEEGWKDENGKVDFWKYYFSNGNIKKEGHYKNDLPSNYWYFYSKNAILEREGDFVNGIQQKWWCFYDNKGQIRRKCQMKNNKQNGYCLQYKQNKIIKAMKFKNGEKVKEWTSISSFKKDNNSKSLY